MDDRSLGQMLVAARERRRMTTESIAATTRISTPMLEALERDAIDELPADVYLRGFVRAYCRAVDLPEAEPLALLDKAMGTRRSAAQPEVGPSADSMGRPVMSMVELGRAGGRKLAIAGAVVAVLVLAALYWFMS